MLDARHAQRRLSGAASVKLLVWIVIFLGVYSAYKFMGVSTVESNIERAVDEMFGKIDHDTSHDAIKQNIIRRVAVASIEIDPQHIQVKTERRPGERLVEVAVAHPLAISFLGSEQVLTADVHASRVLHVDEAALARQAADKRRGEEHWQEVRSTMAECREKWGPRACTYSETPSAEYGIVRDF